MNRARLALMLAMLAPVNLLALPASAQLAPSAFVPPAVPVTLTRTLVRQLFDGQEIVTTRTWRLAFVAEGGGWQVTGSLLDSKVSAPPKLGALARIERNRPDEGLFPFHLDAAGLIVPHDAGFGGDNAAFEQAAGLVSARVSGDGDNGEGQRFLAQLHGIAAGPIVSHWPESLFAGADGDPVRTRNFTLPDGTGGTFTSSTTRSGHSLGGLPATVERRITTTIAGRSSTTIERWSFAAE